MTFQTYWDGNGRVYISGDANKLSGVRADDGFTITIQPSGVMFDAKPHYACTHNNLELTSGMTPGTTNTFTLIVKNWRGLSMSYGSVTGYDTDQQPYIIQVNSAAIRTMAEQTETEELPAFVTRDEGGLMVNGTMIMM